MPRLVDGGRSAAPRCRSSFCRRNPRTGIGVTGDGRLLLVVVDGRSRRSVGMTLRRFARSFLDLGAVEAVNLDGGGSSVMWIRGRGIVNSPSDPGGERPVVNTVMILPGADVGEEPITGVDVDGSIGRASIAGRWFATTASLAASDAGSTGGLAAAWLEGALSTEPVSPALRRIAMSFRAGRQDADSGCPARGSSIGPTLRPTLTHHGLRRYHRGSDPFQGGGSWPQTRS